jgi:hypothetical protein
MLKELLRKERLVGIGQPQSDQTIVVAIVIDIVHGGMLRTLTNL